VARDLGFSGVVYFEVTHGNGCAEETP
jgi:hypothetical protein